MYAANKVMPVIQEMNRVVGSLFGADYDAILYGSYARQEQRDDSDIDLMYLVDASREDISRKNWNIGEAVGELLVDYGILVSPIVENRDFFLRHVDSMPFFQNVQKDGIYVNR